MSVHARESDDSPKALCGKSHAALVLPGETHNATCPTCLKILAANVALRLQSPRPRRIREEELEVR